MTLIPTLFELLDDRYIRDFAGHTIYNRGAAYYRGHRVEVVSVSDHEASCRVRGTRYYHVDLWSHDNQLMASCTCPYAESGWFCKHMVAAALSVREHLRRYGQTTWRNFLDKTIQEVGKSTRRKTPRPYWFFVSLQRIYQEWSLVPYRLWFERVPDGILPKDPAQIGADFSELVEHNFWLVDYIKAARTDIDPSGCVNAGEEAIAFAKLLLSQGKSRPSYDRYYTQDYPLGEYLLILSRLDIPLFLGNEDNPVMRLLHVRLDPGKVALSIGDSGSGIRLSLALISNGKVLELGQAQT